MINVTELLINSIKKSLSIDTDKLIRQQLSGVSPRTHRDVERFQSVLAQFLGGDATVGKNIEKQLFKSSRDSADIWFYPYGEEYELIIEIDATRADQVAKKMLSRFCHSVTEVEKKPLIYVALLYKGTASMNSEECKKYFQMGATVLRKLDERNILIGYIVGEKEEDDDVFIFQTSNLSIQYDESLVYSRESYEQFLCDENVESIENYSMPLRKIETLTDIDKKSFLEVLKSKIDTNDKYICICEKFYKERPFDKNQKSYWNKFIKFLS